MDSLAPTSDSNLARYASIAFTDIHRLWPHSAIFQQGQVPGYILNVPPQDGDLSCGPRVVASVHAVLHAGLHLDLPLLYPNSYLKQIQPVVLGVRDKELQLADEDEKQVCLCIRPKC